MHINQETKHSKQWKLLPLHLNHFELVWRNIFLISLLHFAAFYGIYLKFCNMHLYTRIFGIFYAHIGGFGVTAGRHRYFAHRSYKGNRILDILLTIMASCTYEQSIYTWVRDHRLHHKTSETNADPYNSTRGFFFSHIGWFLVRKHKDVKEKGKTIDMSDLQANPIVMFEHKYCLFLAFIFSILLSTIIPWYFWDESLQVSFFYCSIYRMVVVLHLTWSVNSFAHLYGMRTYTKDIGPVENQNVSLVTFGEGFHNYHHTFPWDYKAGELGGHMFNVTTAFIDTLAWCGLVTERKTAKKEIIESRKERTGDPMWTPEKKWFRGILLYLLFIFSCC